jgi:prepilin-type N-terminal cleavage/methylation domain-containing protein
MIKKNNNKKGFTLIELMVSITIFSIVMLLSVGAITTVLNANTKSKNRKIAIDNLNFLVESMSRSIRFGTIYHCGGGNVNTPNDCPSGSYSFSYLASDGTRITYSISNGEIVKSVNGGTFYNLTSVNDINITALTFRVFGSYPYGTDYLQPQVIINISGTVGNDPRTQTNFDLQNTVSQRKLDI